MTAIIVSSDVEVGARALEPLCPGMTEEYRRTLAAAVLAAVHPVTEQCDEVSPFHHDRCVYTSEHYAHRDAQGRSWVSGAACLGRRYGR